MGPLMDALQALEHTCTVAHAVLREDLGPRADEMERRGWIYPDGYLTHVLAPYFDSQEEVAVEVDESAGVYRYRSPQRCNRMVCRPLPHIVRYAFRLESVWADVSRWIGLEPLPPARRKALIPEHLWLLGEFVIPKTRATAPIFLGRQLSRVPTETFSRALSDPILESGGVILALRAMPLALPGRHQLRAISDFLVGDASDPRFDQKALTRVLQGLPPSAADEPEEWFDEKTGQLQLKHLPATVTFTGKQKKIVAIFWKARHGAPLRWAEVQAQSLSGSKELERAFGNKKPWSDFFVRVDHGLFRLRWAG